MSLESEAPRLVRDDDHGKVYDHPAFGQIRANRVSGRATLYDSDFRHQHYVVVEITGSQLIRGLSRDWHHGRETIVQVAMTEAQWASFVSSFGLGGGVPCTIQRREGVGMVPPLPEPQSRVDQFSDEMKERLEQAIVRLDTAIANAKTKAHAFELRMVRQEILANLPYVAKSFGEHMENTIEAAKGEIHGYINAAIHRAGVTAIAGSGGSQPFALPDYSASAIEAATAGETMEIGSTEGESAIPEGDAQNTPKETSHD
jgi:hypothetical protein